MKKLGLFLVFCGLIVCVSCEPKAKKAAEPAKTVETPTLAEPANVVTPEKAPTAKFEPTSIETPNKAKTANDEPQAMAPKEQVKEQVKTQAKAKGLKKLKGLFK